MKQHVTRPHLRTFLAIGVVASSILSQPAFGSGKPFRRYNIVKRDPAEDEPAKKAKTRAFVSRNNAAVKIYPDVIKRNMHVVAKENDGKEIDFYVFDLQGTLVENYKMKAKDHYRISGLARGTYVYRVFCGDEETASGKFEIR